MIDGAIIGGMASVRAERSGRGDGRVYHIRFIADDGKGGKCGGEVTACVPHDRRRHDDSSDDDSGDDDSSGWSPKRPKNATCVDGGSLYDSLVAIPKPPRGDHKSKDGKGKKR